MGDPSINYYNHLIFDNNPARDLSLGDVSNNYYSHLIFDSSLTRDFYFYSQAAATASSVVKAANRKLPVSSDRFFSPPNSLELTWHSRSGGDWSAEIEVERWRGRTMALQGDTLVFWCYAEAAISAASLPMIAVQLRNGLSTQGLRLSVDMPARRWTMVEVPFRAFAPILRDVDFSQLRKVVFSQSIDDDEPHTLYLDEIKVRDNRTSCPVSPPTQLTARGYDRHVDLNWERNADPEIEYSLVSRSDDGEHFEPCLRGIAAVKNGQRCDSSI
jgi:hypothetical protein